MWSKGHRRANPGWAIGDRVYGRVQGCNAGPLLNPGEVAA